MTGAGILFNRISPDSVKFEILIIFCCVLLRLTMAYLVVHVDKEITRRERYFIVATWLPKATVQASLSSVYLDEVK